SPHPPSSFFPYTTLFRSFWVVDETLVVREESAIRHVYDLEERTARFGESVIDFAKTIPQSAVTTRRISQLVGAASSVGANYVERSEEHTSELQSRENLVC